MVRPSRQQRCNGAKPVAAAPPQPQFGLSSGRPPPRGHSRRLFPAPAARLGTVLSTRLLTKRYGSLTAVEDLDLEVGGGELFGFLGPNGAGKTTTSRCLSACSDRPAAPPG